MSEKRYAQLAEEFSERIREGVLRPSERLPSVRTVSRTHRVSPATVLQAYRLLEDRGEIGVRARSGHYVKALPRPLEEPAVINPPRKPVDLTARHIILELIDLMKREDFVSLGSFFPDPELFPLRKLARAVYHEASRLRPQTVFDDLPPGDPQLRRMVARRYMDHGCNIPMKELIITSGALEALNLCLRAVAKPGDMVAIECPSFYAVLDIAQNLGLKAIFVPTHPREGISIPALAEMLERHPIKVCWVMTNFQNPLGSTMPEDKKRELVKLLERHDVPLIEDDVYAELHFGRLTPKPAKAFDRRGLVLHCSSFSKCLAPGFRVGWAAPGRYAEEVCWLKLVSSVATSRVEQGALAEFLRHGGYNYHLRRLRQRLQEQQARMLDAVNRYFPQGTKVTRPSGGYFLWLELPRPVNTLKLFNAALVQKTTIGPGCLFLPPPDCDRFMRLNYSLPWSPRVESAVATIGRLATSMARSSAGERSRLTTSAA